MTIGTFFFFFINYIITQYINKIKTRRLPGTKLLGVPGREDTMIIVCHVIFKDHFTVNFGGRRHSGSGDMFLV